MTAKMDNNFMNFIDFIDVTLEAYSTAPKKLFAKMMRMIVSTFHTQEIEVEKRILKIDDINVIPINDLEEFYDSILNNVDDIKLFKKKIEPLLSCDPLFLELYTQLDKLHTALIQYIDSMGQLEVRLLQFA